MAGKIVADTLEHRNRQWCQCDHTNISMVQRRFCEMEL